MRARERALAPQPPSIIPAVAPGSSSASSASVDLYTALSAQLREHDLKMITHIERIQQGLQNDLTYICSSIRYLQTCVDESNGTLGLFLFRAATRSLFLLHILHLTHWVPPPAPFEAHALSEDPDF